MRNAQYCANATAISEDDNRQQLVSDQLTSTRTHFHQIMRNPNETICNP